MGNTVTKAQEDCYPEWNINRYETDIIRVALNLSFLIMYITITVEIRFRRGNPMNKLTLLPYYLIVCFQVLFTGYYIGLCLQEKFDGHRNLTFYLVISQFQCMLTTPTS